ncbi:MAG: protein kinase [Gemmatales bacterium]
MSVNPVLVQQLLDEVLDSDRTPEEVCTPFPDLLPEVKDRWQKIRRLQAEIDDIFPSSSEANVATLARSPANVTLPRIEGYEVEAVLGRGGMGIVFRARHLRLNRTVALKMALSGQYAGLQERERFQREAEAEAGLRHPNIVQIYDVGESEGRPYFTLEYVEGGTLSEKLGAHLSRHTRQPVSCSPWLMLFTPPIFVESFTVI